MKFFTNTSIWKKLVVIVLFILVIEIFAPKPVHADDVVEFGGKLLTPLLSLVVSIGDGAMELAHNVIMGVPKTLIPVDLQDEAFNLWTMFWSAALTITVAIGLIWAAPLMFGAGAAGLAGWGGLAAAGGLWAAAKAAGAVCIGVFASTILSPRVVTFAENGLGYGIVRSYTKEQLPSTLYLPTYSLSPEEIFQGKILLFNVNFFGEGKEIKARRTGADEESGENEANLTDEEWNALNESLKNTNKDASYNSKEDYESKLEGVWINADDGDINRYAEEYFKDDSSAGAIQGKALIRKYYGRLNESQKQKVADSYMNYRKGMIDSDISNFDNLDSITKKALEKNKDKLSSQQKKAFENKLNDIYLKDKLQQQQIDADESNPIEYYYYLDEDGNEIITSPQDTGQELGTIVGKWYITLRNIGIVMMMIVLLYIGIRILLSSVASDKAKYLELLKDWLTGMVLLFILHYIMVISNYFVDNLTKTVSASISNQIHVVNLEEDTNGKLAEFMEDGLDGKYGSQVRDALEQTNATNNETIVEGDNAGENKGNSKIVTWFTNLMGRLRIDVQMSKTGAEFIGLGICYCILVFLTYSFIFTYMKRVVYMAFLTIIAPLVAVTYPIDKITDGQAQGFDRWFKEYIFNLLVQPMHLLLYYILVTSAVELSGHNVIYSLCALGFMLPAEKILRSLFGFEKSKTASSLGDVAVGAIAMNGINSLTRHVGGSGDKDKEKKEVPDNKKPRFQDKVDAFGQIAGSVKSGNASKQKRSGLPDRNSTTTGSNNNPYGTMGGITQAALAYRRSQDPAEDIVSQINANNQGLQGIGSRQETALEEPPPVPGKKSTPPIPGKNPPTLKGPVPTKRKRFTTSAKKGVRAALANAPGTAVKLGGKAARIGLPLLGAMMGAVGGIATGDLGNVAKYVATGAATGETLGRSTDKQAKRIGNKIKGPSAAKAFKREYNSRKYFDSEEEIKKQQNITYNKNKELYERMGQVLDDEDMKTANDICVRYGITDPAQIMTVIGEAHEQIEDKETGGYDVSRLEEEIKNAISIRKIADKAGDDIDTPKHKEWEENFGEELIKNGVPPDQVDDGIRMIVDRVKSSNGRLKDIKEEMEREEML